MKQVLRPAGALLGMIAASVCVAQAEFEYALRADRLEEAAPGEVVRFRARALIDGTLRGEVPAPEAWSMSLRASNCVFAELGVGRHVLDALDRLAADDVFLNHTITPLGEGATQAVVLGLQNPVTLAPGVSRHEVLTMVVEGAVPGQGGCRECVLAFEDGVRGGGKPVDNVVTSDARGFAPGLTSKSVFLCDSRCNLLDEVEVGVAPRSIDVDLDECGRDACLRFRAVPGESVLLDVADRAGEDSGNEISIYVRCGGDASPEVFDDVEDEPGRSRQRLVIPEACSDRYSVFVAARRLAGESMSARVTLREIDVAVTRVSPRAAARGSPGTGEPNRVQVLVLGAGFDTNTLIRLRHPDGETFIDGEELTFVTPRELAATFAIPADAVGETPVEFDVVASDASRPDEILFDAPRVTFQIEPERRELFDVNVVGFDRIRVNRPTRLSVQYENTGTLPLPAALLRVRTAPGVRLKLATDSGFRPLVDGLDGRTMQFLAVNEAGVAGELGRNSSGEVPIEILAGPGVAFDGSFDVDHLTPSLGDEIDWPNARPPGEPAAEWAAVWPIVHGRLRRSLGRTWGEYVTSLAAIATRLEQRGRDPASALAAFRFAVKEALDGFHTGAIRGRLVEETGRRALGSVLLLLRRGDAVVACAQSDVEGNFAFDDLEPGVAYTVAGAGVRLSDADSEFTIEADRGLLSIELRGRRSATAAGGLAECPARAVPPLPLALLSPPKALTLTDKADRAVNFIRSWDPNEKNGSRTKGGSRGSPPRPPRPAQRGVAVVPVDPERDTIEYRINFENDPERADTPAQVVEVIDFLDDEFFDLSTLELKEVRFADVTVHLDRPEKTPIERRRNSPSSIFPFSSRCDGEVPELRATTGNPASGVEPYLQPREEGGVSASVTVRTNHIWCSPPAGGVVAEEPCEREWPLLVEINAEVDPVAAQIRWTFETREVAPGADGEPRPEFGEFVSQLPEDPDAGFLLPNVTCSAISDGGADGGAAVDELGPGEGWVSFTVRPRRTLPDGTRRRNRARIAFDGVPIEAMRKDPIFEICRSGRPAFPVLAAPQDRAPDVSRSPTLRWTGDCRAVEFRVVLWAGSAGEWPPADLLVDELVAADNLRLGPGRLASSTTYSWFAIPFNEDGVPPGNLELERDELPAELGAIPVWSFTTGAPPPPCAPVALSPSNEGCVCDADVVLDWSSEREPADCVTAGYAVFVSPAPDTPPERVELDAPLRETALVLPAEHFTEQGSGVYEWHVVALSDDYPDPDVGTGSERASFRFCPPGQPGGLSPSSTAACERADPIVLEWTPDACAEVYDVFLSELAGEPATLKVASDLAESRLEIPAGALEPQGVYEWFVVARNAFADVAGGGTRSATAAFQVCPAGVPFIRGDTNGDGAINLSDGVNVLNVLFLGIGSLPCQAAADTNSDGVVNLSDGVNVLNVLFLGIGEIGEPSPGCDVGDTLGLTCETPCLP